MFAFKNKFNSQTRSKKYISILTRYEWNSALISTEYISRTSLKVDTRCLFSPRSRARVINRNRDNSERQCAPFRFNPGCRSPGTLIIIPAPATSWRWDYVKDTFVIIAAHPPLAWFIPRNFAFPRLTRRDPVKYENRPFLSQRKWVANSLSMSTENWST